MDILYSIFWLAIIGMVLRLVFLERKKRRQATEIQRQTAAIKRYREENELLVWNLAGCQTYADGQGLDREHHASMARPALNAVRRMAIHTRDLREALGLLTTLKTDHEIDASHPVKMAEAIVAHVRTENKWLHDEISTLSAKVLTMEGERDALAAQVQHHKTGVILTKLSQELSASQAQVATLREALKPFAALAELSSIKACDNDNEPFMTSADALLGVRRTIITVGDIRKSASLVAKLEAFQMSTQPSDTPTTDAESVKRCRHCDGVGSLSYNPNLNPNAFSGSQTAKCPHCGGSGCQEPRHGD